jgi:outer membrane receptor protein involved in Fe transport
MGLARKSLHLRLAVAAGAIAFSTAVSAQANQRQDYDIPAEALGDALTTISRLSGREIVFSADAAQGKASERLKGNYTADEAVRLVLHGSGLLAEFRRDVILIRGRAGPSGEVTRVATDGSEILVTGTRIRGVGATSPIFAASRNDIELGGRSSLGDFIQTIPQNYGGGQNPGVAGGGSQGGDNNNINGSANLNLRGLGTDATLTLINGHRVAYDAIGAGVDISAIPLAAVDRIEIVADGASAIYGSDAVAGVANVILRRDFDGLTTSVRVGGSTEGGYFQQQYDAVGGRKWGTGGVMLAVNYSDNDAINAGHRDYAGTMNKGATLFPHLRQYGAVLSGHQTLSSGLSLDLDAQYSHRTSLIDFPNTQTGSVTSDGFRSKPTVETYSVTPTLHIALPSSWEMSLSGTHGRSNSHLQSLIYSGGSLLAQIGIKYDGRVDSGEVSAEGPLIRLPGGDARLAIGTGYRSVGLFAWTQRNVLGMVSTTLNVSPTRENFFGYGELSLPFISPDNEMPFVNLLRFTVAGRYESYRGVGDLGTPKLGLIYQPHPDIAFKASWGKSFKAPTLFEQYQATQGTVVRGTGFQDNPGGRPGLLIYGGGRDLQPEKATTWTASLMVKPLRGLSLEGGYFDVRFRQRIVEAIGSTARAFANPMFDGLILYNPTQQQVQAAIATLNTPLLNGSGAPLDTANISAIFDDRLQNIARQHVRGVDLSAVYELPLGPKEKLTLNSSVSYLKGDRQLSPGQPVTQLVGIIFNPPHWRGRGGATYRRSTLTLSGFVNYSGGTEDTAMLPAQRVGSFTTFDATVRFAPDLAPGPLRGFEFTAGVINLFDRKPPRIRVSDSTSIPYDSTNASAAGRVVSLTVTKAW